MDRQMVEPFSGVVLNNINYNLKRHNRQREEEVIYEIIRLDSKHLGHYCFIVEHP